MSGVKATWDLHRSNGVCQRSGCTNRISKMMFWCRHCARSVMFAEREWIRYVQDNPPRRRKQEVEPTSEVR